MDARTLIDAIEAAGYEARDYSGRAMYGRQCVGVSLDRGSSPFSLAAALAAQLDEEGRAQLADLSVREDAMGLGMIVYFPGVGWPEEDEDPDEDDEGDAPAGTCGDCPTCGSLSPWRCGHNDDANAA